MEKLMSTKIIVFIKIFKLRDKYILLPKF